jgi:hypothetical protein
VDAFAAVRGLFWLTRGVWVLAGDDAAEYGRVVADARGGDAQELAAEFEVYDSGR